MLKYRVEGVGPGGEIQYLKIAGRPLAWTIRGANQLHIEVRGETVQDALRLAARSIEFTPITIVDLNEE